MALEAAIEAGIRNWVGTSVTGGDLEARYDRLGSVHKVALEVLRQRLADLLAAPSSFSIDGDYSQTTSVETLTTLRRQIGELEGLIAGDDPDALAGVVSTGSLVREGRGR